MRTNALSHLRGQLITEKSRILVSGIELASNGFFSSNLYDDGKTSKYEQQNVVAKVDGKMIDLLALNLIEELKGKVELTYRYTAFNLPNMPIKTNTVSLKGFTQAWNYASEICR